MTNVLMNGAIVTKVANTKMLNVTTITHVPMIAATQPLDVLTKKLNVKTMTLVPPILAALSEDANTRL